MPFLCNNLNQETVEILLHFQIQKSVPPTTSVLLSPFNDLFSVRSVSQPVVDSFSRSLGFSPSDGGVAGGRRELTFVRFVDLLDNLFRFTVLGHTVN